MPGTGYDLETLVPGFTAGDYGLLAASFDPVLASAGTANTGGTLQGVRVRNPNGSPIHATGVVVIVQTAGATLTASQNWAAVYREAGTLIGQTTDATTAFGSTGFKQLPFSTPLVIPPGQKLYIVVNSVGTTPVSLARAAATGATGGVNAALSAANSRFFTANTSQTTTAPSTIATPAASTLAIFAGLY